MIHYISGKDEKYEAVFIDFDGTIADTGEGIVKAVRHMFSCIGMEESDEARLRAFIGPPVKHHLMACYGFGDELASQAYACFIGYYSEHGLYQSRAFPGVKDALGRIRESGKKLYVATSKREWMTRELLERFNLTRCFHGIFCADHENGISSKAQVLQRAFELLGKKPRRAVMVGDRCHDVQGARTVGIDSAGVLYGYGSFAELSGAGCDYIVETTCELAQFLGGDGA